MSSSRSSTFGERVVDRADPAIAEHHRPRKKKDSCHDFSVMTFQPESVTEEASLECIFTLYFADKIDSF